MIKRFLYGIIALTIVAFTFTSCEDTNDNFRVDTDSGYVQFVDSDQAIFIGGFHTILEIPIDLHTNTNLAGLDVHYKIEKISEADINSVIVHDPGFVHFEPGQISSTIKIEVKSDIPTSGFMFRITLSSASRDNIDFLKDVESVYLTKDVCFSPITLATDYVGEVYIVELNPDGSQKDPMLQSTITTSLVTTAESNVYTFSNGAWGSDFVPSVTGNPTHNTLIYPASITINSDGTVIVDGEATYTVTGNNGFINPCTKEITYTLEQELFLNDDFLVKVVIRPVN